MRIICREVEDYFYGRLGWTSKIPFLTVENCIWEMLNEFIFWLENETFWHNASLNRWQGR
jgi:hypothetical protein